MRRRRPVNVRWLQGTILSAATVALLLLTAWLFSGIAELVSGVTIALVFLVLLRIIAVRGGRESISADV